MLRGGLPARRISTSCLALCGQSLLGAYARDARHQGAQQIERLKIGPEIAAFDRALDQGVDDALNLRTRCLVDLGRPSHKRVLSAGATICLVAM